MNLKPALISDFSDKANKLMKINFEKLNLGGIENMLKGVNSADAGLVYVEQFLNDPTKIDLRK